jgi:hypothetical protein
MQWLNSGGEIVERKETFVMNYILCAWAIEGKNQGDVFKWRGKNWKILHEQTEPAGVRFFLEAES